MGHAKRLIMAGQQLPLRGNDSGVIRRIDFIDFSLPDDCKTTRRMGKGEAVPIFMERLSQIVFNNGIARCPCCGTEFIDDIPNYGSIISPCCPAFTLTRNVKEYNNGNADDPKSVSKRC